MQTLDKNGIVINSLYICPSIKHHQAKLESRKILWVGRIDKEKRPMLFLELAKHFPENNFLMIGHQSPLDPQYYYQIKKISDTINNVDFLGYIQHDKINKYYSESSIFISTSCSEGFPNTFIEAWGNFVPVVSLGFDPDGILKKEKLGFYAETFQEMVQYVNILLTDEKLRIQIGMNSRRYVEEKYNIEKIINKYEEIFLCLSQIKK
jgi:glycosyltransferase involved in cell wall biosynthesis